MVQRLGSEHEVVEHRSLWWWSAGGAALVFASAAACATGVDVSQAELAEICAESNVECDDTPSGGGTSPVGASGNSGSSGTGGSLGTSGSPSNTGGSSSGISGNTGTSGNAGTGGGSSGSAGAPAQPLQPLARGTCMATSSVVIVYTDRGMGKTADTNLTMGLHVNNNGPAFDLTDLTMRYWFTDDGLGDFTADVDYAQQGANTGNNRDDVSVTFGSESGSNYAAIGFTAGGSVGPEGVDRIEVRLHTSDYKMADQSNDFSYLGSASAVANANITPYVNGTQVGGCVPLPP